MRYYSYIIKAYNINVNIRPLPLYVDDTFGYFSQILIDHERAELGLIPFVFPMRYDGDVINFSQTRLDDERVKKLYKNAQTFTRDGKEYRTYFEYLIRTGNIK